MALQNIGAANRDDAFYRYKMPKMITKIEGRGNGIKTNIVNMVEIAKALARPAGYITKYFGCELGAQSKFDEKNSVSLVNGAHDTSKLAGLLENFIKKYVQCYGCGNPETEVTIGKTQMITLKCAACGFVSDVDMRDKLTSFILKHPPEKKKDPKDKKAMRRAEKERLKEGELADEEQRKMKKEGKKKSVVSAKDGAATKSGVSKKKVNTSDEEQIPKGKIKKPSKKVNGSDEDGADDNEVNDENDDVQWQTDTSLEAARQRIQEQLNEVTAEMVMLSTDGQKTGENSKKQAEENGVAVNGNGKPGEKHSSHDNLVLVIQDNIKKGVSPRKLAPILGSLTGTRQEVMIALFEALFVGVEKGLAKEVGKKQPYLAAAMQGNGSQILLLHAIEVFCEKSGADVVKEVALVVKVLYDGDVLEEDSIMQWYRKGLAGKNKNNQMWKNMKPLIEWLESAESESEKE